MQDHHSPTFISDTPPEGFGGNKYLWGNTPSIDILQLSDNEGVAYTEDLKVLFAGTKTKVTSWQHND